MTYPKHLYKHPGPYGLGARSYAVAGAADEHEEAALIARGWSLTKPGHDPLDHDGDGEKGGSKAPEPTDDLKALREEYREKVGKRPFPGWLRHSFASLPTRWRAATCATLL